ncbi:transketolase family protein [Paenarthrobacter nitroguajacolicus]|uniref:Transketolase family protein n=1 Tax=Paenarthrobacter nitroguajacolicus TaxID=211146 RepID=A0A558GWM2_PAENT|nr:transketolase C-terminal domain-containing protein [Paenarthrobacter nitroguajacolicus]TVU61275.1 transketolase family protein [Paenarthrobacter nitroguajacolicus]
MSTKAQRQVWGETLSELSELDERILVLDGDLATSTRADIIAESHPEKFIQVGIAEQNIVGMAFGLSTLGYRPWLSSFGVFFTNRALDQVRMLVSQTKAPVRIAAAYSGLLNGSSGKTHQDIEDFAIMRAMPNMTVIAPADATEARAAIKWVADYDGPVYIRFARDAVQDVFDEDYVFAPHKPVVLRHGTDLTVVSTGVQTSRVAQALDSLEQEGITAKHIHVPMLKPLDDQELLQELRSAPLIVTVEEHSVLGGLGGLVCELTAGSEEPARVTRLGLADHWSESAPNEFLLDKYGLSPAKVAEHIKATLKSRK